MVKTSKFLRILAFLAILGLFLGCKEPDSGSSRKDTVIIEGIAQLGETLTANTSKLGYTVYEYEWKRGRTVIGLNSSTYTVQAADVGSTITVTASGQGNSNTSAPTAIAVNHTQGLAFTLINNDTAYSVSKGTAAASVVVIPATHNGLPVVEIADSGFSSYTNMTSIIIPSVVSRIGNYAFFNCDNLTSILIPAGITNIGNFAFHDCADLTTVYYAGENNTAWSAVAIGSSNTPLLNADVLFYSEIYPGLTGIHWRSAGGLPKIWITPGLEFTFISEGYWVSQGTATDDEVIIPSTHEGKPVTSIERYGFEGYSNLIKITIPDSVTWIGEGAFSDCSSLTSINVNANNPNYASQDGILYDKAKTSIIQVPKRISGSVTIPDSVISIGNSAFYDCSSLTSITIPNSVISIGDSAFRDCSSLTSISIPGSVTIISGYAFSGCSSLTSISIPDSVTSISGGVFSGCSSLTSISIPNSVTSIGNYAFSDCSSLTSVTIPNSVTSIGENAFYCCSRLTSVFYGGANSTSWNAIINSYYTPLTSATYYYSETNPDTVNTHWRFVDGVPEIWNAMPLIFELINDDTSYSVSKGSPVEVVVIPSIYSGLPITEIDAYGFQNYGVMTSVTIPNSVTSIGNYAFSGCSGLTSISIPDSVTSIGDSAFSGCSSLTSISIPDSVTSISGSAFYGCSSLTSISIPDSVTSIGDYAFSGCSSLTSISIPDSVTWIGGLAFSDCSSLTSIYVNANNPSYASQDGILYNKAKTSIICVPQKISGSITIPNSVTSISESAFSGCSSLTSISIPDSVTWIGGLAFSGCSSLTSISIPDSVTWIGGFAFSGCSSLTSVTFTGTVTSSNFSTGSSFPGDLREKYLAGGIGTYTRTAGSNTWTKM